MRVQSFWVFAFRSLLSLAPIEDASSAMAQQSVAIDTVRSCPSCRITFSKVVSLGKPSDPGSISAFATLARDSRGRFFVGPTENPGEIFVYDANGRFRESLGEYGHGPGEFGRIFLLAMAAGDSLHVTDASQRRYTVLGSSGKVARTFTLPGRPFDFIVVPRHGVLVQTSSFDKRNVSVPVHFLDANGRLIRNFGSDGSVHRLDEPDNDVRSLALAGDSLVWLGRRNKYELQLWNFRTGKWIQRVTRGAAWFPPYGHEARGQPTSAPPPPALIGFWLDTQHRVWTVTLVADAHWKPATEKGELPLSPETWERFYDTIIEVLDLNTRKVITSMRYPRALWVASDRQHVFDFREDRDGDVTMNVWRLSLTPR